MPDPPLDARTFAPGAAWRIAWPLAMVVIGIAVLVVVVTIMDAAGASEDATTTVGTMVGSAVVLAGAAILVRALPPAQRRLAIATKGSPRASIGLGIAIGLGLVVGSVIVISAGGAVDPTARRRLDDIGVGVGSTWWQSALMVIALIVLAPVGEELLFRGLALRGLVRLMPFAWAAPLSGLLFTAAHADAWLIWPRALALVLTGWALAWIYRWRGLVGAVAGHATVNTVAAIALVIQS